MRAALVLTMAALACAKQAPPPREAPLPPLVLEAGVDRAAATTGDVITYTVTVDRADGVEAKVPDFGSEIAGFRIEEITDEAAPAEKGRQRRLHRYKLRADLVGSYVLPALELAWKKGSESGTARTPAIFVEVKTVLKEGEAATIKDLKPLLPLPRRPPYWIAAVLAGVLLAGGAGFYLWTRRRRPAAAAPPPPPPDEVALERLRPLAAFAAHGDREAVRALYFELSEALRGYVEGRWGVPATDRTTPELVRELRDSGVPPHVREELLELCSRADLVKFADAYPSADELAGTVARAIRLVEETRLRREAPARGGVLEVVEEVA